MTKLNSKATRPTPKTAVSANGNIQFAKSAAQQFYELCVGTLFGKDGFYERADQRATRLAGVIKELVKANKLDFVANMVLYARSDMHIRSMPLLATVYFAKELRDANVRFQHLRSLVSAVIQRADQITDMYAVALEVFGSKKNVPSAIKRGVADSFNKFDEYQFAKYKAGTKAVKLRDVLRIVHPNPSTFDQSAIFKRILEDALATPKTWETELSSNGQKEASDQRSKAEVWTDMVNSGKMGYMALLRNLRNIGEAGVAPSTLTKVVSTISNPTAVARSKQFPFAFVKAYKALEEGAVTAAVKNAFKGALTDALDLSVSNTPSAGKNVWVILDGSGSMLGNHYYRMRQTKLGVFDECPYTTGALFAAVIAKASAKSVDNFALTIFSDGAKHVSVNTRDSVVSIVEKLIGEVQGGGTNLQAALNLKSTLGFEPDAIYIISDMQVNMLTDGYGRLSRGGVPNLASNFASGSVKVAFNLEASESTPLHEYDGFMQVSGFSEKVFDLISALREGKTTVERLFSVPFPYNAR